MKKRKKLNANKLMGILFFSLLLVLGTCFFLKSDFFYLKYIEINNNKYLTKEDVNGLLNIEKNKNIFCTIILLEEYCLILKKCVYQRT